MLNPFCIVARKDSPYHFLKKLHISVTIQNLYQIEDKRIVSAANTIGDLLFQLLMLWQLYVTVAKRN